MPNFSRFILLFAIVPAVAAAQSAPADRAAAVLERVQPNDVLRLAIAESRVSGRFDLQAGGGTLLNARTGRIIPIATIDTVWQRASHAALYAKIGAATGAVTGGGTFGLFVYALGGTSDELVSATVLGAAGGGIIGMSLGALAGSFHPKWSMIFGR